MGGTDYPKPPSLVASVDSDVAPSMAEFSRKYGIGS